MIIDENKINEYKEKNMDNENNILEYDEVCPYSEGRAAVRKGKYWGYVDENGKLVSAAYTELRKPGLPYNYAEPFCDGWALVHDAIAEDNPCYLIDRNCDPMMVEGEYIYSGVTMRNGIAIVGLDFEDEGYKEFFVDKDCHVLSDKFEEIYYIDETGMPYADFGNYAMVCNGYKYGLLNVKSFKLELPCEYGWTDFWEEIERLGISFE